MSVWYVSENLSAGINMEPDDDEEQYIDIPFVGRSASLNSLSKAWSNHRLIGVYGLRAIGKSRLVQEFFKNITSHAFEDTREVIVDMRYTADPHSLHLNLCASLEVEPVEEMDESRFSHMWKRQIREIILQRNEVLHLLLFDNAEDVMDGSMKDEFLELVSAFLVTLKNVKLFITSTTKAMFARIQRTYFTHELGPMPDHEASELLEKAAPNVDFGEFRDAVVRLSEGRTL